MDGVSKLYVDANIIIYFIEGNAEIQSVVGRVFVDADGRGIPLVTSDISIAECLHGAYKRKNEQLLELYRSFFADDELIALAPVTASILDLSAQIGADYALKTIDAIHVASAIGLGCDALLTNDKGLRAPKQLAVNQLADWR
ncbi:MAG: type II toxin-antitoxin system VapC family toxin [Methylocystis sp.]|nr:type II toxin-antitoxin system VapC family toxin [Methylocystis sp.]